MNLSNLLVDAGLVHEDDILPVACFTSASVAAKHRLALEIFDNTEFDTRTPAEWAALGPRVPATVFVSVASPTANAPQFTWTQAHVCGFDAATGLFAVHTVDERQFMLPRVIILFKAEDPSVFVARLSDACQRRKTTQAMLLTRLFVDCMPIDAAPRLDEHVKARIGTSAARKDLKRASG
jgi:hypothetical protein